MSSYTTRHATRCAKRKGLALVETAVVLPLVLLLAFAAMDFGRVVHAYVVVSNAARCGAAFGATHNFTAYTQPTWENQVRSAIEQEMLGLARYSPDQLQTTFDSTRDSDDLFQLTVSVSYPFATIVNWPGVPSSVVLSHRIVMRQIR